MSGYIGRLPLTEAIQTRTSFKATAGQTTFSLAYQPGFIDVYQNGVRLREGASEDFIATNGTSIVLNSGVVVNTEIDVVSLTSASIVDKIPTQSAATNGKVLKSDGTSASWETDTNTTYSIGDGGLTTNDFTDADHSKLNAIEASADVTDATNVSAAGAVMESDSTTASMSFVIDEDNMASNLATKVPTQQSVKAYVDTEVSGLVNSAPSTLDTLKELSDALGADANFATTMTNSLATKQATITGLTSTGTELNALDMSASSSTSGQLLTSNGTGSVATWQDAPVSLPTQTSHSGKYLTTNGSAASWATLNTNTTTNGLYEHSNTISANYSISAGNNAGTFGPITVDTGVSVTIPTGSNWTIV